MNGILIKGDQLYTIYDLDDKSFLFAYALIGDLHHMLSFQDLSMRVAEFEGEKILYVYNERHEMYISEVCECASLRLVHESELIN